MTPFRSRYVERSGLGAILDKVLSGERLSREDGLALYRHDDLLGVGTLANHVRETLHGDVAYYIVNQHINHTNVCVAGCKFCAFYRTAKQSDAYVLSPEDVERRMREHMHEPIREIHMVGGVNPDLPFSYYLDVIRTMKRVRPEVHVKAFTMVEIAAMAENFDMTPEEVLRRLKEAGLGSIPGGGAEILTDHAHQVLFKGKIDHRGWMEIAKTAHRIGLKSNATMLFGHVETLEERIEHMRRIREVQDETGGFRAFFSWTFQDDGNRLGEKVPPETRPTSFDYLLTQAVSRIYLDNVPHIGSSWVTQGKKIGQVALQFGADDLGSVMIEENVVSAAGTTYRASTDEFVHLIRSLGKTPVQRDTLYREVRVWN